MVNLHSLDTIFIHEYMYPFNLINESCTSSCTMLKYLNLSLVDEKLRILLGIYDPVMPVERKFYCNCNDEYINTPELSSYRGSVPYSYST
ncbi:hypothetical protein RJT34_08195 [Clitoria ternatea]|uniref:Uncharacterized protein n=1 Tax=Clitoria ternatea TaxID=43366 RepID=A0AAN9K5E2_CLITE